MKRMLLAFLILTSIISCKKEKDENSETPETICIDGRIVWTGDRAVDGTGWVLIPESETAAPKRYILKNLPQLYEVDGLAVKACVYETDEEVGCFCGIQPHYYKLISINRK